MSLSGAHKDFMLLALIVGLPILAAVVFYQYLTTNQTEYFYLGVATIFFMILGVIARYFFLFDYVKTLFDKWR
jgi:uncharacterized membrane protein